MPKLKAPENKYKRLELLIRGTMKCNGVSMKALGDKIGLHYVTVSRHLRNLENIPISELVAITKALAIPADEVRAATPFK